MTGSNHIYTTAKNLPHTPNNRIIRVALISETFTDVRITMIEGETGLRSIIPRDLELTWNRSLGELKIAIPGPNYREIHFFAYSSERPDLLRGPQHHLAWIDEISKLKDANKEPTDPSTTWSNMLMGLRLGPSPHCLVTGTPEPHKLVKYLVAHPKCVTSVMSSLENEHLSPVLREEIERLPKTSRTYRQEVLAEILLDNPDSIFSAEVIDQYREDPPDPSNLNYVLGWDPSMTSNPESDEAGIILSAWTPQNKATNTPVQAYILEDHSGHYNPTEQATTTLNLILDKNIPELILEQNQGAEFVITSLETAMQQNPNIKEFNKRVLRKKATKAGTIKRWKYTIIFKNPKNPPHTFTLHAIHAKVGKVTRAAAISQRYEAGEVHHPTQGLPQCTTRTCLASLEDQMVIWDENTKDSPDRMDAAVYTLLHIFGNEIALSIRKSATIQTAAKAPDLPPYDPRQDLSRPPLTLAKASQAYNVDIGHIGGNPNEFDTAYSPGYPAGAGRR